MMKYSFVVHAHLLTRKINQVQVRVLAYESSEQRKQYTMRSILHNFIKRLHILRE